MHIAIFACWHVQAPLNSIQNAGSICYNKCCLSKSHVIKRNYNMLNPNLPSDLLSDNSRNTNIKCCLKCWLKMKVLSLCLTIKKIGASRARLLQKVSVLGRPRHTCGSKAQSHRIKYSPHQRNAVTIKFYRFFNVCIGRCQIFKNHDVLNESATRIFKGYLENHILIGLIVS